jgi:hypothetical protein
MSDDHFFTVDHLEGVIAVLVDDDGHAASVPVERLPQGIHEGTVVRVTFESENVPNWSRATIDVIETNRRRRERAGE